MPDDSVGKKTDRRPWRQIKLTLPEPIAVQLETALELARITHGTRDWREALECVATSFIEEHRETVYAAIRRAAESEAQDGYKIMALAAKIAAGFRCIRCDHSKSGKSRYLHVHHIWPRSYYGPERPGYIHALDNLAVLCVSCHEAVHESGWRKSVEELQAKRAEANRQVRENGHRYTKHHGKESKWA
jgi:predicted HNH restriction endonuclease